MLPLAVVMQVQFWVLRGTEVIAGEKLLTRSVLLNFCRWEQNPSEAAVLEFRMLSHAVRLIVPLAVVLQVAFFFFPTRGL